MTYFTPTPETAEEPKKMNEVTKKQWAAISKDYKLCEKDEPRKVFEGCISKGGGTTLITEGIHFVIV